MITVGDPLSTNDRIRQKISNDIEVSKKNINQKNLIDIYRTLHSTTAFFSSGRLVKIDQILGNKTNINKFKRM